MKVLMFIGQIILLLFFGFLAREAWRIYRDERKIGRVAKDGVRLIVRVDRVSNERKTWRDYISNSRYVSFHYEGKEYNLRYSQDSVFLQEGVRIPVYYSSSADDFVQSMRGLHEQYHYKTSPLVQWSVIRRFNGEHTALFAVLLLGGIFLVFSTGYLATWTGIPLIRTVGNFFVLVCAVGGAIFFSYDAIAYWRYYSRLEREGVKQAVRVEDTDRRRAFNDNRSDEIWISYEYKARVNFRGEQRVIAIGCKDYEQVHPGEDLIVWNDTALDDMLGTNYTPLYENFIFPLLIWGILLFYFLKWIRRPKARVSSSG